MYLGTPSDGATTFAEPGEGRSFAQRLADSAAAAPEASDAAPDLAAANKWNELVAASAEASRLTQHLSSRTEALADAADIRIKTIQGATGVQLANPFRQGYLMDAAQRYDAARGRGEDVGPRADWINREQLNIFNEKVDAAANTAQTPLSFTPLAEWATTIANNAEGRLAFAKADFEGSVPAGRAAVPEFIGEIAGGLYGARRDPVSVTSLFAGPTSASGKYAISRIAMSGLNQGLFNLGVMALERPEVRDWRAARGQDPGSALPSLPEVGAAFALGFIPGAAIQGAIEAKAAAALSRSLHGTGTAADFETAARALGQNADPEIAATLRAGEASTHAADVAREPPPLPGEAANVAEAQALRHAADPHEPPAPIVPEAPKIDEARLAAKAASFADQLRADPIGAVESLRADDEMFSAASMLDRPDVQIAAKLAMLSDQAWQMVREGRALPEHGVAVSELAARPDDHAALLDRVAKSDPRSLDEARAIVADATEGMSEQRNARALNSRGRTVTDADKSIFELIASRGGLKPTADLKAILDGNPFVPGFGRLLREDGISLDRAWEAAIESGHIIDPGFIAGRVNETGQRELLSLIGEEARGNRQYVPGHEPLLPELAAQHKKINRAFDQAVADLGMRDSEPLRPRVRQLMLEGHDLDTALERAIMEDADRFEGKPHAGQEQAQVPADAGSAPGAGEAAAREGAGRAGSGEAAPGASDRPQPGQDRGADREPGSEAVARRETELIEKTPLTREDGSVYFATRDELAAAGQRESDLADLVGACK